MVDFVEGLVDFGAKEAVDALLAPYIAQGEFTQEQENIVNSAAISLVNLGAELAFKKVAAGQSPSDAPS
jgi:hypothetical protein